MATDYALTGRSSYGEILEGNKEITSLEYIVQISESTNSFFLILNSNRQIVYANKKFLSIFDGNGNSVLGQRPGEAMGCINSKKLETGCGTHDFCNECGVVNSISSAVEGKTAEKECRISSVKENKHISLDLSVKAQPFYFEKKEYVLFSILDISDKKRKEIMERTFFHDILNTAGGVSGFSEILKNMLQKVNSEYYKTAETVCDISTNLIREIKNQQLLASAEYNNLVLEVSEIRLNSLLKEVINLVESNKNIPKCKLIFFKYNDILIKTDKSLLQRILINMVKNAAEASLSTQEVTIKMKLISSKVLFSVHNQTYIEESVQHQIFQRSFSTKGENRGIGTYSMKLFSENYLQGKIYFESNKIDGTTFYLELPM